MMLIFKKYTKHTHIKCVYVLRAQLRQQLSRKTPIRVGKMLFSTGHLISVKCVIVHIL